MGVEPIPPWPGRLIEVGDARIHVRTTPEGPPETAVYVHGLAGSATNWTDLMGELAGEVRGVAVDLPGAGHSPVPADGDYSVPAHAAAVVRLVEALGEGPVHLFGNSMGGAVSVRIAATRPDLVRSLTLVSPALPDLLPRYGPARIAMSAAPRLGELAVRWLGALPPERRVQATLSMCYADAGRVHPERLREAIEELRDRDGLPHAGAAMVGCARAIVREYFRLGPDNLWRQAERITAPTLVVYGLRDRLVHARMAHRAGRVFRDVRLVTLPHAGHVAQMEYPELVARESRRLLAYTRTPLRRTA
ncbi:alpha/beta hydrolase [Microbispora rosea]|uniref:Pimeloyl-ACP methyl ester carboxylesterase n=1 Tax=Microbispora rosea TaxID=58117 RepID=A0A1N6W4N6_9ACTN|nr:alpha/beta fold hydrolase [Microbispora rosea]GIH51339.1 alpha/beta hydrolase [Microbispora rosea subsp. rosea]SIQ84896.1 Pimeloyl-ACP methyl ester carboxylesterase [Microbispora rosea]